MANCSPIPIGKTMQFGETAGDLAVDIDQRGNEAVPFIADHDGVADHRGRAQMILDELRRVAVAARELAHVLQAIEKNQLSAIIDTHRVAGFIAGLVRTQLRRCVVVLQIAGEGRKPQTKLAARIDPGLHRSGDGGIGRHQGTHRAAVGHPAPMRRHEPHLGRTVKIAERHAECVEAIEQFSRKPRSAAEHRARAA
jgi:hypothetical protein